MLPETGFEIVTDQELAMLKVGSHLLPGLTAQDVSLTPHRAGSQRDARPPASRHGSEARGVAVCRSLCIYLIGFCLLCFYAAI